MFIPTTQEELKRLSWDALDVILVSGDTYIDSPYSGIVIIGKLLIKRGYRVGIIAQPDVSSEKDITRLGEPKLFWGISSGAVDSMVANYTALLKKKRKDDLTPGGVNNKRPDRAVIVYTNLIRQYFKKTKPIVLGGIEASLRRIAHYDYWSDKIRKPILFDAKADYLIYGMGEKAVLELAKCLENNEIDRIKNIPGLCYKSKFPPENYIELPSYEEVCQSKEKFVDMFNLFYWNNTEHSQGLFQKVNDYYLIQNPPSPALTTKELDEIYELDYEYEAHPYYAREGKIKALETIQFSITSHRGCFGECNFCSITVHQGKKIISRSKESIIREIKKYIKKKNFAGQIYDIGGPTSNMYGMKCRLPEDKKCNKKRCLFPSKCKLLEISHKECLELLSEIDKIKGIKKVSIGSGIRFDLVMLDDKYGKEYLEKIVKDHTAGQLKIAPEHTEKVVLDAMGKAYEKKQLIEFINTFYSLTKKYNKKQFLTYYFISAHPGSSTKENLELKKFIDTHIKSCVEQIQIFTPTPSTYSALMYYTEMNPFTKEKIFVEKSLKEKSKQKDMLQKASRKKQHSQHKQYRNQKTFEKKAKF